MKAWEELVNGERTVENSKTVEFDLANSEDHDELVAVIGISKHAGADDCNGNCVIVLNGYTVGYYILNQNWGNQGANVYLEIRTKAIPVVKLSKNSNSLNYNPTSMLAETIVNKNNNVDASKFVLTFPAAYSGTVKAEVWGR